MARAPTASAAPPPPPAAAAAGGMGGMMGADPTAGGAGDTDNDGDMSDNVVCTICSNGDGSYTVYAGDEPEPGGGDADMSEDDANAMGAAGAAPAGGAGGGMGGGGGASAPQGQPADSIGAALKLALDILNSDKSSEGAPGNADDQFAAGFSADKNPTPAAGGPAQRY